MGRIPRLAFLLFLALSGSAHAYTFLALTGETPPRVLRFDSATPATTFTPLTITGIGAGETPVGMDLRPATGDVYILTVLGTTGRLYRLDLATGSVSAPVTLAADPSDATAPYTGLTAATGFGIDFNPVVDRLRVVSDADQNLRIVPGTGGVITDQALNPGNPTIGAAAYANNYPGATSTTLYDIDTAADALAIQNPPNNGTLTYVGAGLGVNVSSADVVGLDIVPANNPTGWMAAKVGAGHFLYTLDLTAGTATLVDQIGPGTVPIVDITNVENIVDASPATESVGESSAAAVVTVTRSDAQAAIEVDYATSDGTATAGADYTSTQGTLTFNPGETVKQISVPLLNDSADEPDETLTLTLTGMRPVVGQQATVTPRSITSALTIVDDDSPVPDRDGDGVPDATDNCPNVKNADQADGDKDGLGTLCDPLEPTTLLPGRCANALTGTKSDDALTGTAAGDRLTGLGGADALSGGAGDDCLSGGGGDDFLAGGDGDDTLDGGAGNDVLRGGAGNDRIKAGKGINVVVAGAGDDAVNAVNRKRETVNCGAGNDAATLDPRDRARGCEKVTRVKPKRGR